MARTSTSKLFAAERALMAHRRPEAVAASGSGVNLDDVMNALREIKNLLAGHAPATGLPDADLLRGQLFDLRANIDRTKKEIASINNPRIQHDRIASAARELDAVISDTEDAAHRILAAAERIGTAADDLLGKIDDPMLTGSLENVVSETVEIFEASYFQDITGQRIRKVIEILDYVDRRVNTMIGIWGAEDFDNVEAHGDGKSDEERLMDGPQLKGQGLAQDDIDSLFD